MSNLKKILALVLALVMSMSLVTISSAALTDKDKIDETYAESVAVLEALDVFRGRENGAFDPKATITRAEVAAIIYRVVTGDVEDKQVSIYADYNKFDDVKSTSWYAGYVNYCANAEYVKGYDSKTFGPNDKVTGYQALAMILRAVGYDKNGEFTGDGWSVQTASVAKQLGITDTVADVTLGTDASREVIAELLFRTIAYVPQVTYTLALNYNDKENAVWGGAYNLTLGQETFGLVRTPYETVDSWGRPGYVWFQDADVDGSAVHPMDRTVELHTRNNAGRSGQNDYIDMYSNTDLVVYTIVQEAPVATYVTAVPRCDVAVDLGRTATANVNYYTNGALGVDNLNVIHQHNVKTNVIGGQGSLLEVYEGELATNGDDRIVQIDTYLAEVTGVTKQLLDKNGHVITAAANTLTVFAPAGNFTYTIAGNNYNVGDYVLVSVNRSVFGTASNPVNLMDGLQYIDQGAAPVVTAKQDTIWWNADKHTINATVYDDNFTFSKDDAKTDLTKTWNWYFDQYGNVIGSVEYVTPKTYGVIKDVQWVNELGTAGYAVANVIYMDGTEATNVKLTELTSLTYGKNNLHYSDWSVVNDADNFLKGEIFTVWQYNNDEHEHMFEIDGTKLTEQAHIANAEVLDGRSAITNGTQTIYTDNFTKFLIRNVDASGTVTYTAVTGYDNLEKNWKGTALASVDYVLNAKTGYAAYVYITGTPYSAAATSKTVQEFVYFTGEAASFNDVEIGGEKCFAVYGVVRVDGATTPLIISASAFGANLTVEQARAKLIQLLADVKDELYRVTTVDGIVTKVNTETMVFVSTTDVIANLSATTGKGTENAFYIANDAFSAIDANGVMKVRTLVDADATNDVVTDAININATTLIINEGELGTKIDVEIARMTGKDLYIVVDGTNNWIAKAIFITDKAVRVDEMKLQNQAAAATMVANVQAQVAAETAQGNVPVTTGADTKAGAEAAVKEYLKSLGATVRALPLAGYIVESVTLKLATGETYVAPAVGTAKTYTFEVKMSYNGVVEKFNLNVAVAHAYTATEAVSNGVLANLNLGTIASDYAYTTLSDVNMANAVVYAIKNDAEFKAATAYLVGSDVAVNVTVAADTVVASGNVLFDVVFSMGQTVLKVLEDLVATITLIKK